MMDKKMSVVMVLILALMFPLVCFSENKFINSEESINGEIVEKTNEDSGIELIEYDNWNRKARTVKLKDLQKNFKKIKIGITTKKEILEWFSKPYYTVKRSSSMDLKGNPTSSSSVESYEYFYYISEDSEKPTVRIIIYVNEDAGIVEECGYYD